MRKIGRLIPWSRKRTNVVNQTKNCKRIIQINLKFKTRGPFVAGVNKIVPMFWDDEMDLSSITCSHVSVTAFIWYNSKVFGARTIKDNRMFILNRWNTNF